MTSHTNGVWLETLTREKRAKEKWQAKYLSREEQTLARDLRAACTPEFYLFNADGAEPPTLRYRGQLDASRPGNQRPLNGSDLRAALEAVLNRQPLTSEQIASVGCNVKWHPGQEPDWFG